MTNLAFKEFMCQLWKKNIENQQRPNQADTNLSILIKQDQQWCYKKNKLYCELT